MTRRWARRGPKRIDPQYLAGYLDGEGSFGIYQHSIRLAITNTYPDTLLDLKFRYGGNVYAVPSGKRRWRTTYQWQIFGAKAEAVIRDVIQYLHEKRDQAEALLIYRTIPREDQDRKRILAQRVRDMKRVDHGT